MNVALRVDGCSIVFCGFDAFVVLWKILSVNWEQ